jgi:hypothetical protein
LFCKNIRHLGKYGAIPDRPQRFIGHAASGQRPGARTIRRSIRQATTAAPNPLSMFTTLTPSAHELSIASAAATPPAPAP